MNSHLDLGDLSSSDAELVELDKRRTVSISTDVTQADTSVRECSFLWFKVVLGVKTKKNDSIIHRLTAGTVCTVFKGLAKKFVFQQEISPDGYEHFQCLLRLSSRMRKSTVINTLASKLGISRENVSCAKSDSKFVDYCTKSETRVDGPWSMGFPGIPEDPPKVLLYEQLYGWQRRVVDIVRRDVENDRHIHWIYDADGNTGKTQLVKYLIWHHNAFLFNGRSNDIASRIISMPGAPKLCVMNLARSQEQYVSYQAIEEVKDGLVTSGKYEGGQKMFDSPHVFVFANFKPDFNKMSLDRWKLKALTKSRLNGKREVLMAERTEDIRNYIHNPVDGFVPIE